MKKALWVFAVVLFGCADNPPTIDGYTYKTVKIGNQEWFAENLRTKVYANGDAIPTHLTNNEWMSTENGAFAIYGGGILYNWYAVNDYRCLCPKGWHVANHREWIIMTDFLGGEEVAGEKMKTTYGWNNGGNGNDESGFSGLPGGFRNRYSGDFLKAGEIGFWWSSSLSSVPSRDPYAWCRSLHYSQAGIARRKYPVRGGFSVRCVRDKD